jgi:hypothetical protein
VHTVNKSAVTAAGFTNMMTPGLFSNLTSWERMTYWLYKLPSWRYAYVIEDDVQWSDTEGLLSLLDAYANSTADIITSSISRTYELNPKWPGWPKAGALPKEHWAGTFNVIMRISHALIDRVGEYAAIHHRLAFHEMLFITLAKQHNMSIHYWNCEPLLHLMYRPIPTQAQIASLLGSSKAIFHPVKETTDIWDRLPWAASRNMSNLKYGTNLCRDPSTPVFHQPANNNTDTIRKQTNSTVHKSIIVNITSAIRLANISKRTL